jgi:hypothetical protein
MVMGRCDRDFAIDSCHVAVPLSMVPARNTDRPRGAYGCGAYMTRHLCKSGVIALDAIPKADWALSRILEEQGAGLVRDWRSTGIFDGDF